ncbi:MAG TPA: hypothetical protein VE152_05830, partial [Acidimicrobiales bacterium]|nr:hypothetical protein [Acidimicrobiales bacterium]
HHGPDILLACDLPLVDEALLRLIAGWPGAASVVPVVDSHPQPLCARLSPTALRAADTLAGEGHRSLRALLGATPVTWLHPADWQEVASPATFADTDRPEDLDALGMTWRPP